MDIQFLTIGVYGFDETGFYQALQSHGITVFCDIRFRRGMRGAKYAFVNSNYLQKKLSEMGISYVHRKDLAPDNTVRAHQKAADQQRKTAKRDRLELSPAFVEAYEAACLTDFDAQEFVDSFNIDSGKVVLFCVEREPRACHRWLLSQRLERDLQIKVEHIVP